jgi:hypothetical protein
MCCIAIAVGWRAFYGRDGGAHASPRPDDQDRRHHELGEACTMRERLWGGCGGVATTTMTTTVTDEAATWTVTWPP